MFYLNIPFLYADFEARSGVDNLFKLCFALWSYAEYNGHFGLFTTTVLDNGQRLKCQEIRLNYVNPPRASIICPDNLTGTLPGRLILMREKLIASVQNFEVLPDASQSSKYFFILFLPTDQNEWIEHCGLCLYITFVTDNLNQLILYLSCQKIKFFWSCFMREV